MFFIIDDFSTYMWTTITYYGCHLPNPTFNLPIYTLFTAPLYTPISIFLLKHIFRKTMNVLQRWPEPVVRVQSLSESGIEAIPDCYVKPIMDRPSVDVEESNEVNIPVIDLSGLNSDDAALRKATLELISDACREWGFFQVVNHGVSHQLMAETQKVWREFFHLTVEEKQKYANSPETYEGYGSRVGVVKGARLDWSDYFFLNYLPVSSRDENKWPSQPSTCRYLFSCFFVIIITWLFTFDHFHFLSVVGITELSFFDVV